jgi:hypothetical protein
VLRGGVMETAALETAKLLGTSPVHMVLAIGLVFFASAAVWLGRLAFAEIKSCSAQMLAITEKKIESDNKLADAIDASTRVSEAMLAQVRKS